MPVFHRLPPCAVLLTGLAAVALRAGEVPAPPSSGPVAVKNLTDLRSRVIENNWNLQAKILDFEVKRRAQEAAKGMFDPALAASWQYEDSNRPNTVEQRRQLEGIPELNERNHLLNSSLETLTPLGSRIGLTASVSEFRNNLQQLRDDPRLGATGNPDVVTFVGVTFTQPLLRDAGRKAATAAIRVAATDTEQAWQDYRRQLMIALTSAELAFWNVHGASRQVDFLDQSVRLASQLRTDAKTRVDASKSPPVDVAIADAGLEERAARMASARQRLVEARAVLAGFCGASLASGFDVTATEPPVPPPPGDTASATFTAFSLNPDFLARLSAREAEQIRVEYARNQKLPSLDLKASYGLNGLGSSLNPSIDDITGTNYPAWSVGLMFKMPLGNREAKNRYAAALARRESADTSVNDVRLQISNAVDSASRKLAAAREALGAYQKAATASGQVLVSRLVDLKEGRAEMRRVLEAEQDLREAKLSSVLALIACQQASLEYELATGTVLLNRGITVTKEDLIQRCAAIAKRQSISRTQLDSLLTEVRAATAPDAPPQVVDGVPWETLPPPYAPPAAPSR